MMFAFLMICIAIAYSDIKYRIIPDPLIVTGIVCGLIFNSFGELGFFGSLEGLIFGGVSILIAGCLCFLISEKPALGGGDLKLLAMIGSFWGWKIALITFAIAPILGSIWAASLNRRNSAYGVFLIISSLISISIWRTHGY